MFIEVTLSGDQRVKYLLGLRVTSKVNGPLFMPISSAPIICSPAHTHPQTHRHTITHIHTQTLPHTQNKHTSSCIAVDLHLSEFAC